MAKDKGGKAQTKLPKKLGNVGKKAVKLAGKPVVSEAVAAAMLAAAAALRDGAGTKRSVGKGGTNVGGEASKLSEMLRALALDVARKTIESWEAKTEPRGRRKGASKD